MPPRKKRIRSDDSENSTVDSKGLSSGSDAQKQGNLKNSRHQNKKVSYEDYDGDCELERHDKNRVTKTATRSRVLKQKVSNNSLLNSDSSSSTPVTQMEVDDYFGFENLTTPAPCSPVPRLNIATPRGTPVATPRGTPVVTPRGTPDGPTTRPKASFTAVLSTPKPIFETPLEKSVKKFKRKRVARVRRGNNESWMKAKQEEEILAQFHEVDNHELLIE